MSGRLCACRKPVHPSRAARACNWIQSAADSGISILSSRNPRGVRGRAVLPAGGNSVELRWVKPTDAGRRRTATEPPSVRLRGRTVGVPTFRRLHGRSRSSSYLQARQTSGNASEAEATGGDASDCATNIRLKTGQPLRGAAQARTRESGSILEPAGGLEHSVC